MTAAHTAGVVQRKTRMQVSGVTDVVRAVGAAEDGEEGGHRRVPLDSPERELARDTTRLGPRGLSGQEALACARVACHERGPKGRVEWWRRRELHPGPKEHPRRNLRCVSASDVSHPA